MTATTEGYPTAYGSAGHVLDLIRRSGGLTRADIVERTGLSRATVAARLDTLVTAGLLVAGSTTAARGRPPSQFHLREDRGVLLIADAGATSVRAAVTDLVGRVRTDTRAPLDVTLGPQEWLTTVDRLFVELLAEVRASAADVLGIGIALPGPVDFSTGTVVSPPIMTGWDGYPIPTWFAGRYDCPVLVDNDANAMTVGEHTTAHPTASSMLMLKIATGIGAGIVADGHIYRGADGAAGDLGHLQIERAGEDEPPVCRCGNLGCIEAYAGGWALARDLREGGRQATTTLDVIGLVSAGDPLATSLVRRAGRTIGVGIADAVSLLNPAVVVIGGELAAAAGHLMAGIRESVYRRSLPLATRRLEIVPATLGSMAGVVGLATILTDHIFDPGRIDAAIDEGTRTPHRPAT
ncbi:ROK family protein (fragment) [Nostocoides japonicum T1-X7]|uniref:ROK family protein n=1 Tax=Nostocoides japonicum T1-X7 TaxID=1194083 RepID=A0A077LZI8_9MICO